MLPTNIFNYLSPKVLGQEEVVKQISVSLYKHINGIKWSNILLIGNSGTGKTTIMNAIADFYREYQEMEAYQAMCVMNANTLVDEAGEIQLHRIFKNLESGLRNRLGKALTPQELKKHLENATVCLDEIDKISAKISGRANVAGILIQQALLTILEGETIYLETSFNREGGKQTVRIPIDTSHMLFICGGAFEELYDQVHSLVQSGKDGRKLKETYLWNEITERPERIIRFNLKDYMRIDDLFDYGMIPQFLSRFSTIAMLENLGKKTLKKILLNADDSPYVIARQYFRTFDIDLDMDEEALEWIAGHAEKNTRIGARALRDVFNRVIAEFQFDPFGSGQVIKKDEKQMLTLNRKLLEQQIPEGN